MKTFDKWFRPDTNFQLCTGEWDISHLVSLNEVQKMQELKYRRS